MKNFSILPVIGLSTILLIGTILNAINVLSLLLFGAEAESAVIIIKYISITIIAISLLSIFRSSYKVVIISSILFGFLWYLSARRNPATIPFLQENIQAFFLEGLPYLWFFYYFTSRQLDEKGGSLYRLLYKICKIKLVIALFLQMIMFVYPKTDIFHDYMNAAFAILFGLLFITSSNLKNRHTNKFDCILELLGLIMIFALGSRGSILCYGSLYILHFLFINKKHRIRTVALLSIVCLLVYFAWPALMASTSGSQNRIISMVSSSSLIEDENRNMLYVVLGEYIFNNPLGLGVMSDRVIISEVFPSWNAYYAHNILLELAMDFGYFGIATFVLFLYYIIKSFSKNEKNKYILIVLVSGSLVKLLVSSSLWIDPLIWGLIGVLLGQTNNKLSYD